MLKISEITHQLDGPGSGFGERFWKLIGGGEGSTVLPAGLVLESVSYEDRYLATPVACALLVEVLSALKTQYEQQESWGNVAINVATSEIDAQKVLKTRDQWRSDWPSSQIRDEALRAAFEYCGMTVVVESKPRYQLIHGRRFVLKFKDGSRTTTWLDQGLAYWSMSRQQVQTSLVSFPMGLPANVLGERLAEIKIGIEGHDLATQAFVDLGQ